MISLWGYLKNGINKVLSNGLNEQDRSLRSNSGISLHFARWKNAKIIFNKAKSSQEILA
jgi:hypothetical protein